MHSYKLRARDDHNSVIEEIDFECLSIAGALDKAKAMVKASLPRWRADLFDGTGSGNRRVAGG